VAYVITAILCVVIFVICFPCLLLLEPFLRQKLNLVKVKPLLDQYQGSYKDKYRWFAAYYFICQLIIFFISYAIADYQYRLYCLQSTCIIIVLIHVLIHPYKNKLLNMLDSTILLNMVLIANPTSFQFAKSTTIAVLITNPICCLVCTIMTTTPIKSWILKCKNKDYHELYSATENNQPAVR